MLSRLINALAARTRHHGGVTHAGNAARAGVPVVGLRPLRARYDAAVTTDGNRRHWANADGLSADAAASPEVRRVLRNRARYEVANNSYARGIVCTLANDVVGTGPRLQMLTGDPEADRRIEAAFADWACAVGLAAKLRTMRMARAESGESFALLARNPGNGSPVQLDVRLIEADQVATPDLRLNEPNAIDGIIFDEVGNPIEYHVLKRHPGAVRWTTGLQYDRIAAAVIIHYFRADRPGQSRGVPDITQALPLFAQLRRFTLAVISAAETAADFAGVLYTDAPANGEAEDVEPMDAIELEQRMLLTMPGGWKMAQLKAEQPATTYAEFNRELIATIAKVTAIVLGVGIALVVAGAAIVGLGTVFGSLATIVAGVGAALGVVASVLGALLSPIGLIVAAVVGLGGALLVSTGVAGEALDWLGEQFGRLRDRATKVVQGITDALAAGDVALAAEILWLSLKLIWQKGVAALNSVWLSARNFFITTAQKMWFGALAAAQIVWHALEVGWIETTAFLSKTWTRFATGLQKVWESATSFIAKRMLEIQGLFDSSLDVDAAKRLVDEQLESRLAELDAEGQRALDERERRRQGQRDQSAELNEATLAEIGRQFEEAQAALRDATDEKLEETQRRLDEARAKLDEAIDRARRQREEGEAEEPGAPRRAPQNLLDEFQSRIAGIGQAIARGVTVRGTFNAAAAQGLLGAADAQERTAHATEQTARNTKRLVDATRNGGLAFA